jgi:UDP-N-acetylmuramoyl-L-alanyl-D-glutamate--2,6-diaminopimelate ligase
MMRVSELIRHLPITPDEEDVEVTGLTHDSRRVTSGDLFVALVGDRFDGRAFVGEARRRGAVAVLAHGSKPTGFDGPWLSAEEPRLLLGPLSSRFFAHPDRELLTVGITGTNGKSTVATLLTAVLEAAEIPAATLGTLGYRFRDELYRGKRTTPEATDLFRTLRRVRDHGAQAAVMEISSHAIEMHRVDGLLVDLAVFTNLSRDHLDFHPGLEDYFAAKRRLFDRLKPGGKAVVNIDDEHGRSLASELQSVVTFGREGDVGVLSAALKEDGIVAEFRTPRGSLSVTSGLRGRFHLDNLLATVAAAEVLTLPPAAITRGLSGAEPIRGRMEAVEKGQDFPVFIDYAHTPAALAAALESLKEFTGRRIALVFGCGGDRDPGKRPLMGQIAGERADLPIATTDNPRGEDPLVILRAVEEGLRRSGNSSYRVVPDRREAIRQAIAHAAPGWTVLVAGKGHEEVQVVGDRVLPFSDRREVEAALEERLGAGNPE